ncbi:MAG: 6,7-dimethyl-8-ribityllumazine synthase [Candidatus Omnitrophica bacterium]|nr:6,7-dimethyl-8-ribityllumazine synthase [Candidatus Omnitrophota bacterium]MCF7876921.1 6,7-dimethyl-8-ribityllumazine synthase [Candidatus Omnitrophota bacterium]MCF7878601.1 6,7-dimethyl-8-ribityllumazine synthase [Candidatus Omnitrophota bacterium]MCF7893078.1 6,7-dimethyl-8-ribityllumazine synthase [Candidatus Omnitrophota bacterium]
MKQLKGKFDGRGKKIAIVVSRFNEVISKRLLEGCMDTLKKCGTDDKNICLYWSPGSFEIPQILSKLQANKFDAIVTLGAVIRGDTPHFEYISSEVTKGIAKIAQDKKIPIAFGIITADTIEQATERSGTKQGNKGSDAAFSALEMANLYSQL